MLVLCPRDLGAIIPPLRPLEGCTSSYPYRSDRDNSPRTFPLHAGRHRSGAVVGLALEVGGSGEGKQRWELEQMKRTRQREVWMSARRREERKGEIVVKKLEACGSGRR